MSDSSGSSEHDPGEDPRRVTATPFLAAVAIVTLVIVGIFVAGWISPADENVTESDRINRAVADYVQAHNHNDSDLLDTLVCENYSEDRAPVAGRDGEIEVAGVDEAEVNGDRARAQVRINASDDKGETTDTWELTRDGDKWVICN
ncbi:hypothetical protein [Rhodococcus sp. NPDC058521]|uniref:Rv0361 family membrane protein n=1 Tax=Rhodococcus sp. NPDC058521 TaxID=3346536 RepID=UPI0036554F1D